MNLIKVRKALKAKHAIEIAEANYTDTFQEGSVEGFESGFKAAIEMLEDYKEWKLRGKVARSFEEWVNTVYIKKIR